MYEMCNKNVLTIIGKITTKKNATSLFFQHIFAKLISNVKYVSINKKPKSFQNCFGVLSRFARDRVKSSFLISNISRGQQATG